MEDRANSGSGRSKAFEEALCAEYPALQRYVQLRLWPSVQTWVEVEDVVQDVLVHALDQHHKFDPRLGTLRRWLGLIVHTIVIARLRAAAASARFCPVDRSRPKLSELAQTATSLSSRVADKELRHKQIALVLDASSADERTMLMLRADDVPFAEIASTLNISNDAARARWHRLVVRLESVPGDPFGIRDLGGESRGCA